MGGKKNKGNKGGNNEKPQDNQGGQEQFKFDFSNKDGKKVGFDLAQNPELLSMVQSRMQSLVGTSSGYLESLPESVQNRIRVLRGLSDEKQKLTKQYKTELAALEAKYQKLDAPLFERRKEIIGGSKDITEDELKNAPALVVETEDSDEEEEGKKTEVKKEKTEDKKEEKSEADKGEDVKGIPNFWTEVLKHHGDFAEMITKEDEKALKYLVDIRSSPLNDDKYAAESFVIEFEFKPENPYFDQTVLSKKYFLSEDIMLGDTNYEKMEGTDIAWKDGKNLTVKLVKVQQGGGKRGGRGGRGGRKGGNKGGKTITVEEPCDSFFNIFKTDIAAAFGIDENDEDFEGGDMQELYEVDYEMAVALKSSVIPFALLWFTGELDSPADYDEFDGEGGFEEGEEYDSEEDSDFEQNPNQPQAKPEDCKQQ